MWPQFIREHEARARACVLMAIARDDARRCGARRGAGGQHRPRVHFKRRSSQTSIRTLQMSIISEIPGFRLVCKLDGLRIFPSPALPQCLPAPPPPFTQTHGRILHSLWAFIQPPQGINLEAGLDPRSDPQTPGNSAQTTADPNHTQLLTTVSLTKSQNAFRSPLVW